MCFPVTPGNRILYLVSGISSRGFEGFGNHRVSETFGISLNSNLNLNWLVVEVKSNEE